MKIRIRSKLFLAMLALACGVVVCMFLVMRWSFHRGFLDYVNKMDLERIDALAEALEKAYAREGSWRFLKDDPRRWRRMLRASVPDRIRAEALPPGSPDEDAPGQAAPPPRRRGPPGGRPPAPPPGPLRGERGHLFPRRVALLDAGKRAVFAPSNLPENLPFKPLMRGGETVGYLGLVPLKALADARQLRFLTEQRQASPSSPWRRCSWRRCCPSPSRDGWSHGSRTSRPPPTGWRRDGTTRAFPWSPPMNWDGSPGTSTRWP